MKIIAGILAGSLVSALYMIDSHKWYWWILAFTFVSIVAYVRS